MFKKLLKKSPVGKLVSKSPSAKLAAKAGDPLAKAVTGGGKKASTSAKPAASQPSISRHTLEADPRRALGVTTSGTPSKSRTPTTAGARSGVGRMQKVGHRTARR